MANKVVGIDLAGKEDNETGYCCLDIDRGQLETKIVHSDGELLAEIKQDGPQVIAVDAPFTFPESGQYRDSDLKLQSRGFKPLSPVFPGMRVLVNRAQALINKLRELPETGKIIEAFPRASEKKIGLERDEGANKDEYDALLCALTAREYIAGNYTDLSGVIVPG